MTDRCVTFLERLELVEELFYRATGMLAPGRSYPAVCPEPYTYEERRERYRRWLAREAWVALGEHAVRLQSRVEELEAKSDD